MVVIKLLALGAVHRRRRDAPAPGELPPVRAERLHAASTRARRSCSSPTSASTRSRPRPRRRKNPQRNLPIGILGGLAICTLIYVIVGVVLTGHGAVQGARGRRPAGARAAARRASTPSAGSSRSARRSRCRRCCWCSSTASRASSSRWRATACCRSGRRSSTRARGSRRRRRCSPGVFVALWSLDRRRRRDLRPDQHRHAVRVHAGQHRRARAALHGARPARARSACRSSGRCALARRRRLRLHHGGPAARRRGSGSASGWSSGCVLYFVYGYQAQPAATARS